MELRLTNWKDEVWTLYKLAISAILIIVVFLLVIFIASVFTKDISWMLKVGSPMGISGIVLLGIVGAIVQQSVMTSPTETIDKAPIHDDLQAFLQYVPGGVIVVDELANIQFVNDAAADIFQYDEGALLGKKIAMLLPNSSQSVLTESIKKSFASGNIEEFEVFAKRKGNIFFPALFSVMPVQHNKKPLVALMVLDGIQQHQTEDDYSQLHQFSVQQAADAIVWLGKTGQILYANNAASQLAVYNAEELEQLNGSQLCLAFQPAEWDKLWVLTKKGGSCVFESKLKTKMNEWIPVEIVTNYVALEGRTYVCAYIKDITNLKVAETRLQRLANEIERKNQELEQFSYIATHNLQEPLRLISSFAQILTQRYEGKLDEDADDFIGYVVEGVHKMQDLLRDLSNYSNISSQSQPFELFNTRQALNTSLHKLHECIEESGAILTTDELPMVRGNSRELGQLFFHLINNAITYRHPKLSPQIEITAERGELFWVFAVKDNGIGIAPEYHDQIFKMFHRLHAQNDFAGTGMGLAICQKIVEKHGGRIWLESAPQQGTTFYFTLPIPIQMSQRKTA